LRFHVFVGIFFSVFVCAQDAGMLPRDLKKYQDFLKEPQQYGEPQLRGGARDWLQRNAQTAAAFQTALASGMTVAEAEQAVLQQAQSWHLDISQGDIAAIPLQTQVTQGWSTRDLKRHYIYIFFGEQLGFGARFCVSLRSVR
jgi:hypothetical protein